jgi:hypothetical protein
MTLLYAFAAAATVVAVNIPGCIPVEQDRCLDRGGMWNERDERCEYEYTRESCQEKGGRPTPTRCVFKDGSVPLRPSPDPNP